MRADSVDYGGQARLNTPLANIYRRRIDEQWDEIITQRGDGAHVAAVVCALPMCYGSLSKESCLVILLSRLFGGSGISTRQPKTRHDAVKKLHHLCHALIPCLPRYLVCHQPYLQPMYHAARRDIAQCSWTTRADTKTRYTRRMTHTDAAGVEEMDAGIGVLAGDGGCDEYMCGYMSCQVMEAVMHGAGGMDLIDPLFQHQLAKAAKARKVPVVMDEVFAGLWRLGRESACHLVSLSLPLSTTP